VDKISELLKSGKTHEEIVSKISNIITNEKLFTELVHYSRNTSDADSKILSKVIRLVSTKNPKMQQIYQRMSMGPLAPYFYELRHIIINLKDYKVRNKWRSYIQEIASNYSLADIIQFVNKFYTDCSWKPALDELGFILCDLFVEILRLRDKNAADKHVLIVDGLKVKVNSLFIRNIPSETKIILRNCNLGSSLFSDDYKYEIELDNTTTLDIGLKNSAIHFKNCILDLISFDYITKLVFSNNGSFENVTLLGKINYYVNNPNFNYKNIKNEDDVELKPISQNFEIYPHLDNSALLLFKYAEQLSVSPDTFRKEVEKILGEKNPEQFPAKIQQMYLDIIAQINTFFKELISEDYIILDSNIPSLIITGLSDSAYGLYYSESKSLKGYEKMSLIEFCVIPNNSDYYDYVLIHELIHHLFYLHFKESNIVTKSKSKLSWKEKEVINTIFKETQELKGVLSLAEGLTEFLTLVFFLLGYNKGGLSRIFRKGFGMGYKKEVKLLYAEFSKLIETYDINFWHNFFKNVLGVEKETKLETKGKDYMMRVKRVIDELLEKK